MNKDEGKSIEGDLQDISRDARVGGTMFGKYFSRIPAGRPGTREGIAFQMLMFGTIPTTVRTLAERVTVIVDESRAKPWADVEMDTGFNYTTLKISSAELKQVPCLKEAKRN